MLRINDAGKTENRIKTYKLLYIYINKICIRLDICAIKRKIVSHNKIKLNCVLASRTLQFDKTAHIVTENVIL